MVDSDVELQALQKAVDSFLMVDTQTAKRMLQYLEHRFVINAKNVSCKDKATPETPA